MQSVYEFNVKKEVEQEVKKETENGTLVTTEKIEKPIKIIFKKPSRAESEEADTVSAVEFSESIRKGILTKPLLEKLYDEKGGFLSEDYQTKYGKLLARFYELENERYRLSIMEDKTVEDKEKINQLSAEFVEIANSIQALESSRNNLFQNTAENRAQNKTIFWLILFLTYIQEDENEPPKPFFNSKSKDFKLAFDEKRDDWDSKADENNSFYSEVMDKASFFVSLWYFGRASTKEDFKRMEETVLKKRFDTKEDTEIPAEEEKQAD